MRPALAQVRVSDRISKRIAEEEDDHSGHNGPRGELAVWWRCLTHLSPSSTDRSSLSGTSFFLSDSPETIQHPYVPFNERMFQQGRTSGLVAQFLRIVPYFFTRGAVCYAPLLFPTRLNPRRAFRYLVLLQLFFSPLQPPGFFDTQ